MLNRELTSMNFAILGGVIIEPMNISLNNNDNPKLPIIILAHNEKLTAIVENEELIHYIFNHYKIGDSIVFYCQMKKHERFGITLLVKHIVANSGSKKEKGIKETQDE